MPKPIPYPYQQNSRRLWLPWGVGWRVQDLLPAGMLRNGAWSLPNSRRWRKVIRQALGAASAPSYQYTDWSGRYGKSEPAWQDLPKHPRFIPAYGYDLCYDPTLPLGIMDTLGDHITEVVTRATAITPPEEDK